MSDSDNVIFWGVRAIAAYINTTPATAYHLLDQGKLPCRKGGKRWAASRESLRLFVNGAPTSTEVVAARRAGRPELVRLFVNGAPTSTEGGRDDR